MSFAPKQFIRSVDFLSTENAISTSTGSVNIYGGMSVSKDSYLTNMIVVGNTTVANLNISGSLTTSNGNTLTSSQWTSIDSNTDIYFGTSANSFVGICTTTPGFNLDISGGSRITGGLTVGNLNVNTGATITNILNTTICTGTIIITAGSLNAGFNANTIGNIFTTAGNVGINNVSPSAPLHIIRNVGNSQINPLMTLTALAGTDIGSGALNGGTINLQVGESGGGNVTTYNAGRIVWGSIEGLYGTGFETNGLMIFQTADNTTLGNLLTLTGSQRVGINNTNPSTALDVIGSAKISGTINSGDITVGNINFTGSLFQNGSAYLGSQWTTTAGSTLTYTSGNVSINSGFTSTFNSNTIGNIFTTGGNVGIGTSAPISTLDIAGTVRSTTISTSNMTAYNSSIFLRGDTNHGLRWAGGGNSWGNYTPDGPVLFGYAGGALGSTVSNGNGKIVLTWFDSGNVGIGTTSPSFTLDVSGTGRITTSLTTGSLFSTNMTTTNIVGTNMTITNMNSSTNTIGTLNATGITTASLLATSASIGNISAGSINLSGNMNISGTLTVVNVTTTNLTMSNGNALLNLVTSGTILNTGTITSGPLMLRTPNNYDGRILTLSTLTAGNAYNLTINAVNDTNNNIYWSLGQNTLSSTYSNMLTFYGGNVGINTTQPSSKFVISDTGATKGHLKLVANTGATEDNWWLGFSHVDSSDSNDRARIGVKIQAGGAGRLFFTTGGYGSQAERMTIDANGNVGIGTTSPTFTLDVTGTADFSTSVTTAALYSTNQTTTNIVGTNSTFGGLTSTGLVYLLSTAGNIASTSNNYTITSGSVNITGDVVISGNQLFYTTTGVGAPAMNGRGNGSKIVLYPETGVGLGDYSIGIESGYMWFQVPNINYAGYKFYQGTTTSLIITPAGNVGIGSASAAAYILDVAGTTKITNTTATSMGTLIVAGPGSVNYTPSTATSGQLASFYGPGGNGIFSHIDFSTFLPGTSTNNQPAVRFSMKDLGAANSDFNILTRNGGSTGTMASRIFIDGSGNIGINTTNPGTTLHISGPAGTGTNGSTLITGYDSYGHSLYIGSYAVQKRLAFNHNGTVGNIFAYDYGSGTAQNLVLQGPGGSVGIGTASPLTKLHVEDGSVFIGDVSAGFSTSVPSSAGAPIATANGYRLFFDNSYNATAGTGVPANKIVLHNNSFTCGFGIENTGVTYHSGDSHRFYCAASNSSTYGSLSFLVNSTQTIAYTNTNSEGLLKIGNSNAGSSAYSMLRIGNNIGDAVMFLNSNTRTIDGGINTFTIRNDTGALRLQGSGATNTIFLPGSSTNVGINTSSPRANLEITQTSSTTGMMLYSGSNDGGVNRIIFNHSDTTSNYQKVSIETQASGAGQAGRGNFSIRVNTANDNTNVAAGDTRFFIHGTSGNVGIMTTSPSYPLHVSGDIYATGDVISFSDARLKTDVQTINNALDKVSNMRGVYYTNLNTQTRETGVIAQEIMDVLPEVVADRGEYLGVAYGNIVGVLIESIKELKARIVELESRH